MSKKSILLWILIIGIGILTLIWRFVSFNFPHVTSQSVLDLHDSESVCSFVHQNARKLVLEGSTSTALHKYRCNNYECDVNDNGKNWDVRYRCPGPKQFPMGQMYVLRVNKLIGSIKLIALSN